MMVLALVALPIVGILHLGGPGEMAAAIREVDPALLTLGSGATAVGIVSALAWGLGYVGQPHILVRFMALRAPREAVQARRIGIGWMLLACVGAIVTALVGIGVYQQDEGALPNPEGVFIALGQLLFHPLIAGFMLAAILAAIMSTISSQLLVTSSALVEDIYRAFSHRQLSPAGGVWLGRTGVLVVSVVAALLAWGRSDTILGLVAFAWAGFGAGLGPVVVLSLYWRRLTTAGAVAGMVAGSATVFAWNALEGGPGGVFDVYEILPAFLLNLGVTVAVSLSTHRANPEIEREFDSAVESARS